MTNTTRDEYQEAWDARTANEILTSALKGAMTAAMLTRGDAMGGSVNAQRIVERLRQSIEIIEREHEQLNDKIFELKGKC